MSRKPRRKGNGEPLDEFERALYKERDYDPKRGRRFGVSGTRVHSLTFAEMQMLMLRNELRKQVYARFAIPRSSE